MREAEEQKRSGTVFCKTLTGVRIGPSEQSTAQGLTGNRIIPPNREGGGRGEPCCTKVIPNHLIATTSYLMCWTFLVPLAQKMKIDFYIDLF